MKKLLIFGALFYIFIIVNISISTFIYAHSKKETSITIILDELNSISDDKLYGQDAVMVFDIDVKDKRVAVLKSFFRRHNSPLYELSEHIVKTSDDYQLDYRIIPAIAMQESTACKFIPRNSYNCWGWGIYGDKITRFGSYSEAISTVAKGLKTEYFDKGFTTPEKIMSKYTPSSNGSWARGVTNVFGVLE